MTKIVEELAVALNINPPLSVLFAAGGECPPGRRKCPNSDRCILESYFCDGDNDCEDFSDEDSDSCREF